MRGCSSILLWVLAVGCSALASGEVASAQGGPGLRLVQPDPGAHPELFGWTDTCNVYVLREGEAAP